MDPVRNADLSIPTSVETTANLTALPIDARLNPTPCNEACEGDAIPIGCPADADDNIEVEIMVALDPSDALGSEMDDVKRSLKASEKQIEDLWRDRDCVHSLLRCDLEDQERIIGKASGVYSLDRCANALQQLALKVNQHDRQLEDIYKKLTRSQAHRGPEQKESGEVIILDDWRDFQSRGDGLQATPQQIKDLQRPEVSIQSKCTPTTPKQHTSLADPVVNTDTSGSSYMKAALSHMRKDLSSIFTRLEKHSDLALGSNEDPHNIETDRFLFKVPLSSYGTAMMVPRLVEIASFHDWLLWAGTPYLCLLATYIVQGAMTSILFDFQRWGAQAIKEANHTGDGCFRLITLLYLCCAWLHISICCADMKETLDMLQLLMLIPTSKGGGFSISRKVFILVVIILPKFVIAVLILVWGAQYLATSENNQDLLLNAVALVFVMDVDEIVSSFMAPNRVMRVLEQQPSFKFDKLPGTRGDILAFGQYYSSILNFAVSVAVLVLVQRTSIFCKIGWDGWSHVLW